jgi:hypothetical protein
VAARNEAPQGLNELQPSMFDASMLDREADNVPGE